MPMRTAVSQEQGRLAMRASARPLLAQGGPVMRIRTAAFLEKGVAAMRTSPGARARAE